MMLSLPIFILVFHSFVLPQFLLPDSFEVAGHHPILRFHQVVLAASTLCPHSECVPDAAANAGIAGPALVRSAGERSEQSQFDPVPGQPAAGVRSPHPVPVPVPPGSRSAGEVPDHTGSGRPETGHADRVAQSHAGTALSAQQDPLEQSLTFAWCP